VISDTLNVGRLQGPMIFGVEVYGVKDGIDILYTVACKARLHLAYHDLKSVNS
jgi:hypothetical protein